MRMRYGWPVVAEIVAALAMNSSAVLISVVVAFYYQRRNFTAVAGSWELPLRMNLASPSDPTSAINASIRAFSLGAISAINVVMGISATTMPSTSFNNDRLMIG